MSYISQSQASIFNLDLVSYLIIWSSINSPTQIECGMSCCWGKAPYTRFPGAVGPLNFKFVVHAGSGRFNFLGTGAGRQRLRQGTSGFESTPSKATNLSLLFLKQIPANISFLSRDFFSSYAKLLWHWWGIAGINKEVSFWIEPGKSLMAVTKSRSSKRPGQGPTDGTCGKQTGYVEFELKGTPSCKVEYPSIKSRW